MFPGVPKRKTREYIKILITSIPSNLGLIGAVDVGIATVERFSVDVESLPNQEMFFRKW